MEEKILGSLSPEEVGAAIKAFRAEKCPACGGAKVTRDDAFCKSCFNQLPQFMQTGISDRGQFIQAFNAAFSYLKNGRAVRVSSPKTTSSRSPAAGKRSPVADKRRPVSDRSKSAGDKPRSAGDRSPSVDDK